MRRSLKVRSTIQKPARRKQPAVPAAWRSPQPSSRSLAQSWIVVPGYSRGGARVVDKPVLPAPDCPSSVCEHHGRSKFSTHRRLRISAFFLSKSSGVINPACSSSFNRPNAAIGSCPWLAAVGGMLAVADTPCAPCPPCPDRYNPPAAARFSSSSRFRRSSNASSSLC